MQKPTLALIAAIVILAWNVSIADDLPKVEVYKSPTCTCCTKWAAHLEAHGFSVATHDEGNMSKIKKDLGVPLDKSSCHTATVDGYIIEGHVPAEDVIRLLETRPSVDGLTVPGMPLGSPGMEAPQAQAYKVYTFNDQGETEVFAEH